VLFCGAVAAECACSCQVALAPAPVKQYLLPTECSEGSLLATAAAAVDQWDRQMDAQPFHIPCCAYYADSVNNSVAYHV